MTDQKIQIKYKYDNTTYASLDIPTTGYMAYRDKVNIPVVGTNGTELIQGMANSFFAPWGSKTLFTNVYPDNVGWLTLAQGGTSPNCLVAINATIYNDPNEWFWFTLDGGTTWTPWVFSLSDPQNPSPYLNRVKYSCIHTDNSGNQIVSVLRAEDDSQNVVSGKSAKFTINPITSAITRTAMNNIGASPSGANFTAMCDTPSYTLAFTEDGKYESLNVHGTSLWTTKQISTTSTSGIHTAIYSIRGTRTTLCGANGYLTSNRLGGGDVGEWTQQSLSPSTYGELVAMTEDNLGTMYILGQNKIRMIGMDGLLTNTGVDIDLPTPPKTSEQWSDIIVHNNTIMIASDRRSFAILPLKNINSGTWRFTTTDTYVAPVRILLKAVGGKVFIRENDGTIGGVAGACRVRYSYTSPPSSI